MRENFTNKFDSFCRISSAIAILAIFLFTISYLINNRDTSFAEAKVDYTESFTDGNSEKVKIWNFKTTSSIGSDIYVTIEPHEYNWAIMFDTKDTYVNVYNNNKLIYSNNDSVGICWHKLYLSANSIPANIRITCIPAYSDNKCCISHFYAGDANACTFNVLYEYLPAFTMGVFFIIVGLISLLCFAYYYFTRGTGQNFLFIGSATLITAMWSVLDTGMLPFIWGNSNSFNILSYIVFFMVPISFGQICAYRFTGKLKLATNIYILIAELNLLITCFGYLLLVFNFHYARYATICLILMSIPLVAQLVFTYEIDGRIIRNNLMILMVSLIIVVTFLLWMLRVSRGYTHDMSFLIRTSIFCFQFCIIGYHAKLTAVKYRTDFIEKINHENKIKDQTTGFYNKGALLEKQLKYSDRSGKSNVGIAYFYLRHLKSINESYGYSEGTKLLTEFASGLHSCFPNNCDFYRIGNRKFYIIIPGENPEDVYVDARSAFEIFCNETNEYRSQNYKMVYNTSFVCDHNLTLFDLMDVAEERV